MCYISVSGFAKQFNISRQFVWKMIREGKLRAIRIGKIYKIPMSEVDRIEKGEIKMKIYIVKAPQGEYEDYREPIVKVFADKAKAEEYVKAENAKLPLEQADKCEECLCKWKMAFEHNDEKPKCFNPDKYKTCQNYFKYSGIYPLLMEEYEVVE